MLSDECLVTSEKLHRTSDRFLLLSTERAFKKIYIKVEFPRLQSTYSPNVYRNAESISPVSEIAPIFRVTAFSDTVATLSHIKTELNNNPLCTPISEVVSIKTREGCPARFKLELIIAMIT